MSADYTRIKGPDEQPDGGEQEIVTYHRDQYFDFVEALYKKYPGEWFAIAIEHEDNETGMVTGRIIAHHPASGMTFMPVQEYRQKHPNIDIDFFTTDMARPIWSPI